MQHSGASPPGGRLTQLILHLWLCVLRIARLCLALAQIGAQLLGEAGGAGIDGFLVGHQGAIAPWPPVRQASA